MGVALMTSRWGLCALPASSPPLPHAEAMLLVHNGKAKVFEHHRLGEHRMGAHHQTRPAVGDGRQGDAL